MGISRRSRRARRRRALKVCASIPFLIVFGALIGACSEQSTGSPVTVSDSTGIRVITVDSLWTRAWPELNLAKVDTLLRPDAEDPAFGTVALAVLNQRGMLAVLDGQANEVRVRPNPEGEWFLVSQEGGGPTETGAVSALWWKGDTLAVYDSRGTRLLRFEQGRYLAEEGALLPGGESTPNRAVAGSRESVIVEFYESLGSASAMGVQRPHRTVIRADSAGTVDTIGVWPGTTRVRQPTSYGLLPFGAATYVEGTPRRITIADAAHPTVFVVGPRGELEILFRWTDPPRLLTEARTDRFAARMLEKVSEQQRSFVETILEELPFPDTLPRVGDLLASDSAVLIARFPDHGVVGIPEEPYPAMQWRIVHWTDPDGIRSLSLPEGVVPLEILSDGRLLVRIEDDLGRHGVAILASR